MNGHQNLVLPFRVNLSEVESNKEAVLNGMFAIQHFFDFLFLRGVVGATDGLCDWFPVRDR